MEQLTINGHKKYAIEHDNTDVRKLWNLASNGVIDRRTVNAIFDNEVDGKIVFNSRKTYETFKACEFTVLAYYDQSKW